MLNVVTYRGATVRIVSVFALLAAAAGTGSGCYSTRARDESRLAAVRSEDPQTRLFELEKAASLATAPSTKAKAYVAAGQAAIEINDIDRALRYFHEARRNYYEGEVAAATNRGIGEAYFAIAEYSLARRYLLKGLEGAKGDKRELALAMLVVCSRGLGDVDGAVAYRDKLTQPLSADVVLILGRSTTADVATQHTSEQEPAYPRLRSRPERRPAQRPLQEPEDSLVFLPRDRWNARAPRSNIEAMGAVTRITVHHTGGDSFWSDSRTDAADEIRKIQKYHQDHNKWADIGYHFIIDRTGVVWQGRRLRYQGAHAGGDANLGNIGVVLLGNFVEQNIPAAQRQSLNELVSRLCYHFSLPAEKVYTHREIRGGTTDCPGPALTRCVKELRGELRRRLVAYRP